MKRDRRGKIDKVTINNENLDKRVKLTAQDKADIVRLYASKEWSQRKLAQRFGVSRRSIQFVLDPKKLEENKKRRAERGGSKVYYNTEYNKASMQKHRAYKKQLFDQGLIGNNKDGTVQNKNNS